MKFYVSSAFLNTREIVEVARVADELGYAVDGIVGDAPVDFRQRDLQQVARGQNHGTFDEVLQFTNVAWPLIAYQRLHGFRRNGVDHPMVPAAEFLDEVADQLRDIFLSLPQRRHSDWKDI